MAKYSIGAKIFAAFVAMSLIIAATGFAGYLVLSAAGNIAVVTYDGPLMAISYSRAAHADFIQMQALEQRIEHADPSQDAALASEMDDMAATFSGDLDVAASRASAPDEHRLIEQIGPLVKRRRTARAHGDQASLARLEDTINEKFDLLIELITDHGFVARRQTVTNIADFKYASVAITVFALLLAAGITLALRSRIVRPLRAAARVADRIAHGELETTIPQGGADETGALLNSMTVMQDNIREAMTREKELRRSAENRLVDALETSREGVMLVDPDGKVVMSNSTLRWLLPRHRLQADARHPVRYRACPDPGPACPNRRPPRGHYHPPDMRGAGIGGWPLAAHDRKRDLRRRLDLLPLRLYRHQGARGELAPHAKREAEAANASKTRFLANMSHELRTPLNAIIGFSEIINGQFFGEIGNERYLDYSGGILRSGRHLLAVINDVLDLSKSEAGKMVLMARDTDMADLLSDCIAMVGEQCAEAGLDLAASGLDQPLTLNADPAKLRQIFSTSCPTPSSSPKEAARFRWRRWISGTSIAVTVADTGIGMDPADVEIACSSPSARSTTAWSAATRALALACR